MANETANEVLQLAITIEEEGQKFYEHYASKANDEAKNVLLKLASDEIEHASFFKKLYNELEYNEDDYLFDETVVTTFRSYAKSAAFSRSNLELGSFEDVIKEGIKTEKLTIQFYEKLLNYASEDSKKVIKEIIEEENRHATTLENLLKRM